MSLPIFCCCIAEDMGITSPMALMPQLYAWCLCLNYDRSWECDMIRSA
jgi:hypothetical protein